MVRTTSEDYDIREIERLIRSGVRRKGKALRIVRITLRGWQSTAFSSPILREHPISPAMAR